MNKSDSITALAPALLRAQGQIKAALKDSTNPHFKSKYADLSSVIEAVKSALQASDIAFLQGVHDAVEGVAIETMLLHKSGEWISSTMRIPAVKQDAQGYGSAITYGRRYGLQSMCGVPAEDDDGNAATASASRITPNAGAGENLTEKQKSMVRDTQTQVADALAEDRDADAYALCESITQLEEKLFLWSLLDSKQRRRIKEQQKREQDSEAKLGPRAVAS